MQGTLQMYRSARAQTEKRDLPNLYGRNLFIPRLEFFSTIIGGRSGVAKPLPAWVLKRVHPLDHHCGRGAAERILRNHKQLVQKLRVAHSPRVQG